MLSKQIIQYKFNPKRNFNLTTPCCNRKNKDGKFINYIDLPEIYGYCHSCGKTSLPPTIFKDEKEIEYTWNEIQNKFEPFAIALQNEVAKGLQNTNTTIARPLLYIDEAVIWGFYNLNPENNLLQYLRKTYCNDKVEDVKQLYAIGTNDDGGTMFWNINKNLQVQKVKISYYDTDGKRTDRFKVPYKNENGYFACLFGEHLLSYDCYKSKIVILTESEKTAIVGHILLPEYLWLAYGGCNGLTENKLKPLIGHQVLIIPDISETAVAKMFAKLPLLKSIGIDAKIWDMTDGKTDDELKIEGIYNNDLEDVFRKLI